MDTAKHLDITANKDDYDSDVAKIMAEIRPQWKKEDVEIKPLSGGTVNVLLKIVHNGDLSDGLVLRINGDVSKLVGMSREKEMKHIRLLNEHGLGVPLVASFNNGIVIKLLRGQMFDGDLVELLVDENFVRKFTKNLAKIHGVVVPDMQPITSENYVMMNFVRMSMESLKTIGNTPSLELFYKEVMTLDEMKKEADFLFEEAQKLNMPICLSHNDLWHNNMLYDKEKDTIYIIDYETSDINYRPFDLAAYLLLLLKSYILPGLPSPKVVRPDFVPFFIRCYLEAVAELEGKPASSVTTEVVEEYQKWVDMCQMVYILTYTPLMIFLTDYQQLGGDDMNGAVLARIWMKEYKEMKNAYKF